MELVCDIYYIVAVVFKTAHKKNHFPPKDTLFTRMSTSAQKNFCLESTIPLKYLKLNENRWCSGGSRAAAASKMEHFVIIVNGWMSLTIITKRSIMDVAAALDPPLLMLIRVNKVFKNLINHVEIFQKNQNHNLYDLLLIYYVLDKIAAGSLDCYHCLFEVS